MIIRPYKKRTSNVFTYEKLAKLLGIEQFNDEPVDDGTYGCVYGEALAEGKAEDEAERLACDADQKVQDKVYIDWTYSLVYVANRPDPRRGTSGQTSFRKKERLR